MAGNGSPEGWPANRWVDLEQEVVLNEPGKANGIVRLWVNDELRVDAKGLNLGANDRNRSQVLLPTLAIQPKATSNRLTMSAFIVQRQ